MSNVENTEKGLNFIEKALAMVEKYRLTTIFKAVFVVLIAAATIGFIKNPVWVFEQYDVWKEKEHQEKLELRMANNHKIQSLIEKSLYRMECDRIILLETHNGNTGIGGLPFAKCTATYEYMDDNILPVASQYQDFNLSLMPFATYLFEEGYWCGDTEDLSTIDKALYHKMAGNGTEHFAACVIEGVDKPLAFLFVSFSEIPNTEHNCDEVRENIRHLSLELALLLEIGKTYK